MRKMMTAVAAAVATMLAGPSLACAVSRPLPESVMAARQEAEGEAWRDASVVFVGRVVAVSDDWQTFTLERVRTLRGEGAPQRIDLPPEPAARMCVIYHGLNVDDGAAVGDEFVIYALDARATPGSRLRVVSTRMVRDPATRAALDARVPTEG